MEQVLPKLLEKRVHMNDSSIRTIYKKRLAAGIATIRTNVVAYWFTVTLNPFLPITYVFCDNMGSK